MERGSAKHSPRLDEQQKHEIEGMMRGGGTTHAEEWREPEPTEENLEEETLRTHPRPPGHEPGVPEGITPADVERRSSLARWLADADFPAGRDALLAHARRVQAPDAIIDAVAGLPDERFANIARVAVALGLGIEKKRW